VISGHPISRRPIWLYALIALIIASGILPLVVGDQSPIIRSQDIQLFAGDTLVIGSDQNSIQRVILQGNLTAVSFTKPSTYPTNQWKLQSLSPGSYQLTVLFDLYTDYQVNVYDQRQGQITTTNSTYYFSSGPSELDIKATFIAHPANPSITASTESPWDSLVNWMGNFSEAFPLWVKVLYLLLGVQFFAVGGLWIRRETARREGGSQKLDAGNKAFLWLDVAYKFFLAALVAIVLIMGGELLVLFILRFMFLASLDLLSLWDIFVVGFAVGATILFYLIRFAGERALDLKPLEDE